MFCEYCGTKVDDNTVFCPNCGMPIGTNASDNQKLGKRLGDNTKIENRLGGLRKRMAEYIPPEPPKNQSLNNTNSANRSIEGSSFNNALADGEVIVKRYNCADIRGVKGYLTVTNKRLLFDASSTGISRFSQEVTLSSVSGLSCYRGTNFNFGRLFIGAIVALVGLIIIMTANGSFISEQQFAVGVFILFIGGLIIYTGIKTAFQIAVYAKDVSLSPIVVGEGPTSLLGNSALFAVVSTPTLDTDLMLSELGALVQDLQSMGDLAIEKWQNKVNIRDLPNL